MRMRRGAGGVKGRMPPRVGRTAGIGTGGVVIVPLLFVGGGHEQAGIHGLLLHQLSL